jgi:hypothetical protein
MKKIFEKSVLKSMVFAVFMLQLFCVASINAAQNDNLQLEIGAGKPAASPNVAFPNEETVFNFKVWVIDSVTRKEVTPLNIKECIYKLECPSGTITKTEPTMTIATDKHSATLTDAMLYYNIKQTAKCPSKGKLKSTLNVQIVFNDNSSLSKSFSIEIDVVEATVTVYAKKPNNVVERTNNALGKIVAYYDLSNNNTDILGHSFWKCSIDESNLTLSVEEKNIFQEIAGKKFGFYPKNDTINTNDVKAIVPTEGKIVNDDAHSFSASIAYSITVDNAKKVINKTNVLLKSPYLAYNVLIVFGENCTSQCVKMCNDDTGVTSPNGEGYIGVIRDGGKINVCPYTVPNPYHHANQIESKY